MQLLRPLSDVAAFRTPEANVFLDAALAFLPVTTSASIASPLMPPQSPATVCSPAISQRLLRCPSHAESWLQRLRALVEHRDHVNVQGTQWFISDQLRDVCLAAQRDTFIPCWRTVMTSLSHHELVQRTRLDNQYTLHMQQLRIDWHGINVSNPGSIRVFTQIQTVMLL